MGWIWALSLQIPEVELISPGLFPWQCDQEIHPTVPVPPRGSARPGGPFLLPSIALDRGSGALAGLAVPEDPCAWQPPS